MFLEYFNSDSNINSFISANISPGWMYTHPSMNLKISLAFTFTRQTSPAFASFIPKLIYEMSMLTLLQSVKLLMLQYMAIPTALLLDDDDDTATDDVVAICLRLAVLQYDLRSTPGTFTGMKSFIQVSLIAR
ncbi:hypothetical protein TNCT_432071 [Trichonephila clavata]|uniref:Uncharacterized protein n=1 Tax=Trichonephila clavata TaxID=2740835 RepID=A0A8X6I1F2_TRICU|nr:hypothetical protein TNCT_432071 [Trichonephila clavata]